MIVFGLLAAVVVWSMRGPEPQQPPEPEPAAGEPAVKADADGFVKIDFTVPADLPAGTHLMTARGATSQVPGVAAFQVTVPVVVSSTAVASAAATATVLPPAPVLPAAVPGRLRSAAARPGVRR